jgi:hypothetical protein
MYLTPCDTLENTIEQQTFVHPLGDTLAPPVQEELLAEQLHG